MDNNNKTSFDFPKSPSGIQGLDEITSGGLPLGRATLVMGNAGCGKTLLGLEFLVRGIQEFGEPGLFLAFEETADELTQNVKSLGWDLDALVAEQKLFVDYVYLEPQEIIETGSYDLEGLFIRLAAGIEAVGAKRLVLDTIETLFSSFSDANQVRAELRRLIRWLKAREVTTIFTGEVDSDGNTRYGIEEFVSDCVIRLDHRTHGQLSTRRLKVSKYRGSRHGTNEYPFVVGEHGFQILPVTSLSLNYQVSDERVSSGIPRLDIMLGDQGYFRGSSILISGTAGAGKTSFAAQFVNAACQRGERALYISFEESPAQLRRNMRSIGLDLVTFEKQELLVLHALRPTTLGIDALLLAIHDLLATHNPEVMVIDPISNLIRGSDFLGVNSMLTRLLDDLKRLNVTSLFTDLTDGGEAIEATHIAISSMIDTWILLRADNSCGERNRLLHLVKSRGMAHSNQIREFLITDRGIELLDVYLGINGVVTGSARYTQESHEKMQNEARLIASDNLRESLVRQQQIAEAQIAVIQAELAEKKAALNLALISEKTMVVALQADREAIALLRRADT